MRRFLFLSAIVFAMPAAAASGGALNTLMLGSYECERGGAAASPPTPEPGASFEVTNASRYLAGGREGTYLLIGDTVTMTSGPLAGTRLVRVRSHFLRRIEDGKPGAVRCVHERRTDLR